MPRVKVSSIESKGRSPFYPDQPVPVELFRGRSNEIEHILRRGAGQVVEGKPVTMFIEGEYGIGKSSIAAFTQWIAEKDYGLHGIYCSLGTAKSLEDVAEKILTAIIRSGAYNASRGEKLRNWLSRYIGEQKLFGFSLNLNQLKADVPNFISTDSLLDFFQETIARLASTGIRGIFLVLDEINGISSNIDFAHFLKGLVDMNALRQPQVPLLMLLCGVQERRQEIIRLHEPVGRIFEIISIHQMTFEEMRDFYQYSFNSVGISVTEDAMQLITEYAAGFPKIMHLIGNAAFWHDEDKTIDAHDASNAIFSAAEDVGNKYVDQQVYKALRSKDYRSILKKIAETGMEMSFTRSEIIKGLSDSERKKFDNFLRKMKSLQVIKSGELSGEYRFIVRMVRLYIWLQSGGVKGE